MHDHVKISRTLHGPARRLGGGFCGPAGLPTRGRTSGWRGSRLCVPLAEPVLSLAPMSCFWTP
eukprot:75604-Heterocapsa_arctica.AAC.1